jgi:voltage-gated potassium channel
MKKATSQFEANFLLIKWWSVITITTVGYGDYTPITPIGRIIGTAVKFSGIGLVVTLATILALARLQALSQMSILRPQVIHCKG